VRQIVDQRDHVNVKLQNQKDREQI
jgi:hypothetical protein